jgi:DNA-binding MarR family transcriptional regulator
LLKRLESAGLVSRRRDATDERRVLIEVTDEGWALRERVAKVPRELFASLGFSTTEAQQLRRLLGKLLDSLDGSASDG